MPDRQMVLDEFETLVRLESHLASLRRDFQRVLTQGPLEAAPGIVAHMAEAVESAESDWRALRSNAVADPSPALIWADDHLVGRPLEDLIRDAELLDEIRTNWQECQTGALSVDAAPDAGPYDRFVAYEVSLMVALGVPVGAAWSTVRRAFPGAVGRVANRPDAYPWMLQNWSAQEAMSTRTFSLSLSPISVAGSLVLLADDDPADPLWKQRVARSLRSSTLKGSLQAIESVDCFAGEKGNLASIFLAGLRGVLEFGREDPIVTGTGIVNAVGGAMGAVIGENFV